MYGERTKTHTLVEVHIGILPATVSSLILLSKEEENAGHSPGVGLRDNPVSGPPEVQNRRVVCRVLIPVYMSHRIYTRKRDEPGATENAIKFWILSAILLVTDFLESAILDVFPDFDSYPYILYLGAKSVMFVWLFWSNFHNSKVIYDGILPKLLPALEPTIDFIIAKANVGVAYFFTHITPALARSVGAQLNTLAMYCGEQLVKKLVFKAASTEPARLVPHVQQTGLTTSFVADEGENLLAESPVPANLNTTQIIQPKEKSPEHAKIDPRMMTTGTAI